MGHYAKVLDGKALNVIVAKADFFTTFVDDSPGTWIKTSYNTRGGIHYEAESNHEIPSADQSKALRMNYAGIGLTYDETKDAFIDPQPFPSWTLNDDTCLWVPPIAEPNPNPDEDGKYYDWNEELYHSDNTKGWVKEE